MPGFVEYDGQRLPGNLREFLFRQRRATGADVSRIEKTIGRAMEILQEHLPERKVIGIDCVELIWGLGAIHCLSQQQPKV